MISSIKNRDDLKDLEELADIRSKANQVRLDEKLGRQGFHFDTKELFEPTSKAVTDTIGKLLEETKSNSKAVWELDESNINVKGLELMNGNGLIDSSLIRPIIKRLVVTNESQFRFYDDLDSDNWKDYVMKREKITIYSEKLVFKPSAKSFTLR